VAKVIDQIIPVYQDFDIALDEPAPFFPVYRNTLQEGSPRVGLPENTAIVSTTKHGKRPATRTKRKKGFWTCRDISDTPINYSTISDAFLFINRFTACGSRLIMKRATQMWKALPAVQKQCWLDENKRSGKKCSYYDFYVRAQIKQFRLRGTWDITTCRTCPPPEILYVTRTMLPGEQQRLNIMNPDWGPFEWHITAGGGTLVGVDQPDPVFTAPQSNVDCTSNTTIMVKDSCDRMVYLTFTTNSAPNGSRAYYITNVFCWSHQPHPSNFEGVSTWGPYCYACFDRYFDCAGNYLLTGAHIGMWSPDETDCAPSFCDMCLPENSKVMDIRSNYMKQVGCCPSALY